MATILWNNVGKFITIVLNWIEEEQWSKIVKDHWNWEEKKKTKLGEKRIGED